MPVGSMCTDCSGTDTEVLLVSLSRPTFAFFFKEMFLKKQIKGESCIFTSSQFVHNEYFILKNALQPFI